VAQAVSTIKMRRRDLRKYWCLNTTAALPTEADMTKLVTPEQVWAGAAPWPLLVCERADHGGGRRVHTRRCWWGSGICLTSAMPPATTAITSATMTMTYVSCTSSLCASPHGSRLNPARVAAAGR
jgi:hypothetical protein